VRKSGNLIRNSQTGALRKTQYKAEKEDFSGQKTGFEEAPQD
jgi:hypothetical protein